MVPAIEALNHGQVAVSQEQIINIIFIHPGGNFVMSEEMHKTTNITGNSNSSIVNESEHSSATTNIQQTQNQPIDMATTELIRLIYDHMGAETGKQLLIKIQLKNYLK